MKNHNLESRRMMLEMDIPKMAADYGLTPEVAEVALHKARFDAVSIPREMRAASREWLESRGYKRMMNMPWPPAGVLP